MNFIPKIIMDLKDLERKTMMFRIVLQTINMNDDINGLISLNRVLNELIEISKNLKKQIKL